MKNKDSSSKTPKSISKIRDFFSGPGKYRKLGPIIFVGLFAIIGTTYILASHALSGLPYTVAVKTVNTSNQVLPSVTIYGSGCSTLSNKSDQVFGLVNFSCSASAQLTITAISLPGYQVSASSQTKVGSVFNSSQGLLVINTTVTMEPIPAPGPAPAPTPAPAPASPSSPKSSNGSSSSHASSTKTTTSTPVAAAVNPTSTDSSTADQSTDDTTTDQSSGSFDGANVMTNSDSTITSSDNLVAITFPSGTFNTDAFCSIDPGDSKNVPVQSSPNLIGPYSITCTDSNGNLLDKLNKSITVAVSTSSSKSKYTAYVNDNGKWATVSSTPSKGNVQFKLAKADLFAAAPAKTKSLGPIINIVIAIVILLLLFLGVRALIRRRQNQDTNNPYATNSSW